MNNDCFKKRLLALTLASLACFVSRAQTVMTMYYAFPAGQSGWQTFTVPLTETSGWTWGSPTGPSPTYSQFVGMLSSLNGLIITNTSGGQIFLDNIYLGNTVSSTFPNCTTDGWMIRDTLDASCNSLIGNPAGSINNGAITPVYYAPAKYLGNQSAVYGLDLNFDEESGPAGYVILTEWVPVTNAAAGSVVPWGDNYSSQVALPAGLTNVVAISGGAYDSFILKSDGTVTICGWDVYQGGPSSNTNIPPGLSNVISIAAGEYHFLALKNDGTVAAWGSDTYNQTNVPPGLSNVVAISGGEYHSMALKNDGTVVYWGTANVPPTNLSNVVAIAAGQRFSMALKSDGTVALWGDDEPGLTNLPPGLTNITAIAAGFSHAIALTGSGKVIAWGSNADGQTNVPPGLSNVVAISAGAYFNLALKSDGTIVSWGDNTYMQRTVPAGVSNVVALAAGGYHSLGLIGNGPPQSRTAIHPVMTALNSFAVSIPTQSGHVYRLEYKNSLTNANWTALPLVAGTGTVQTIADTSGFTSERFYRVRKW